MWLNRSRAAARARGRAAIAAGRASDRARAGAAAAARAGESQSSSRSGWYGRHRRRGLALGKSRHGDVARGAGFKVAAPWGCGMEHRRHQEVELRRRCDAMSVQPLWWRRVGLGFVRGVDEDAAVPVEQVKAVLWGWSSRDRRGDRRAAPWRWRTGRLNRRDGEMDDRSSSGEVDE